MASLAPLLITSIIVCVLIGGVLLYLRGRQGAEYLKYWAISFFIIGSQHLFAVWAAFHPPHPLHGGVLNLMNLCAGGAVLVGTYAFLNRPTPKIWFVPATLIAAWSLASPIFDFNFLAITIPAFWFRGLTDVWAGFSIARGQKGTGPKITGIALFLWGLHQLNYPFLRPVEWFAPWGFSLGMLLGFVVGVGILMTHYEITRRELAASEDVFRSLFENSADGLFLATKTGKLLKVNPTLESILGYKRGDMLGLTLDDLEAAHGPMNGDEPVSVIERQWKRLDGRQVHLIIRTRDIPTEDVTLIGGSVRDVTQTRVLQEQLNLARRMDALGRLAGGIAHDFNNILTAVLGSIDLMELELDAGQTPTATLEILRMSTLKAAELSTQLLGFTRQRSGEKMPNSLSDAVVNTEAMLRRLLPETISLQASSETGDAYCMAEPGQLERVLLNLAVNAQDAMPNGGVLEIKTHMSGTDSAVLTVHDTGVGIDPAIMQQIFEPLFSTKGAKGTGLGLANVFMLVESIGGTISVESDVGAGSTFTVTLPVTQPTSTKAVKQVGNHTRSTHQQVRRILLVEDRDLVRDSIRATLENAGYKVTTAVNGEDAMRFMAKNGEDIDIVLTDVLMPIMSGPALIDHLLILRPDLKFLMISGHPEDELEHFGLLDRHFLAKPFSSADLLDKLDEICESQAVA